MKSNLVRAGLLISSVLLLAQAMAGGSPPPDTESGPGFAPFDLSDPVRIDAGRKRFDSTCAAFCHGHAPPLFIGRKDLAPEHAFKTITDGGGGATPMPPWGDVFTREEIWELVAYIKHLGTLKPE
ncbi:c-type cytochrome [Aquariibacter albus]|uniref:Cytochrome c n=1 Tax=Aquariibacter albus TaxID=2759899 RepID=A0A839HRD3_9BURK|nr:cytochrome c [Aquariibacter albus]MBB1162020.1 cytochrome c [Aquariibacter albus]